MVQPSSTYLVSPGLSPAVLDDPVVLAVLSAIAHHQDTMVQVGLAARILVDACEWVRACVWLSACVGEPSPDLYSWKESVSAARTHTHRTNHVPMSSGAGGEWRTFDRHTDWPNHRNRLLELFFVAGRNVHEALDLVLDGARRTTRVVLGLVGVLVLCAESVVLRVGNVCVRVL
jgi:hypothetical protein